MDTKSPCKDLLFQRGPNLGQKPLYLVASSLNLNYYLGFNTFSRPLCRFATQGITNQTLCMIQDCLLNRSEQKWTAGKLFPFSTANLSGKIIKTTGNICRWKLVTITVCTALISSVFVSVEFPELFWHIFCLYVIRIRSMMSINKKYVTLYSKIVKALGKCKSYLYPVILSEFLTFTIYQVI